MIKFHSKVTLTPLDNSKGVFGMERENVRERELIKRGKGKGKGYGYMLFGITM